MASLQNAQIDQSYQGLIKTADNTSTFPFPGQNLQFGDGTTFPIEIADLSAFGAGNSIALKVGTNSVSVDNSGFYISAPGTITPSAGTVTFSNGTFKYGSTNNLPVTNVDFTDANVDAHQIDIKGDGTNAGKLKLYCEDASGAHNVTLEGPAHAGGATYSLKFPNVQSAGTQILEADASGNLSWINTPSGGGGGGSAQSFSPIGASAAKGVIPYQLSFGTSTSAYKTNQMLSGYSLTTAGGATDAAYWQPLALAEGETLSSILLSVQTASAGSTAEVALYDLGVGSDGITYINNQLSTLGTIDTSTTGDKIINLATPFTMPSGKLNGQVALVVFRSDNAATMKGWSQSVFSGWGGNQVGGIYYRAMSPYVDPGVSPGTTLPATIGPAVGSVRYGAMTSNPLMVLYRN